MNRNEIKQILLLYRPGSADAEDPQIAEALALAKQDTELARWLEEHCARQAALRAQFRQIAPPAGLKEQIISEHAARPGNDSRTAPETWPTSIFHGPGWRGISARQTVQFALAALLLLFGTLAVFWLPHHASDNTLAIYQNQMARVALSPYAMDVITNDPAPIRAYLAQKHAPANFVLRTALQQATVTGCAVEDWQGAKVTMICFHTGKPHTSGATSDLWLFVVDRAAVKNAPEGNEPQLAKVNRLFTASWTQGDKLYFLGTEGDEAAIRQYL